MHTVPLKLVTIVGEAVLAESLVQLIQSLGATGYTLTDARGEGSRGMRTGEIPGDNIRIEALVGAAKANLILEELATRFFPNYAIAAWAADVQVVRGEKYA